MLVGRGIFHNLQHVEVKLSEFYFHAGEVRKAIISSGVIAQRFGGSARLIVPNTILVQNDLNSFGLYTGLTSEQYSSEVIASYLGGTVVSHRGIDTQAIVERRLGECSLVLSSNVLLRIKAVFMSDNLKKEMKRKNSVVAYSLGDQAFLCMGGQDFLNAYCDLISRLQMRHNLSE